MSKRGWLLFGAMSLIWGVPYLLIKVAVREIDPAMLVEMRTGGTAVILLPIAVARGELAPVLRRWKPVLCFCVAETALPWLFLFNAERKLASSLSGLLVAAVPLVGALLGRLTGTDRLTRRRLGGMLVGFAGVAALVGFDVSGAEGWYAASMAVVVVGYAIGPWILARHLADVPGLGVIACALGMCAVLYAPVAAFEVPTRTLSSSVLAAAAGLVVVCTAVAFVLFFALIAEVGPVRATLITYVNPAVAVVLGVSVLNERFGISTAVGFALIIVGCVLASGRRPGEPVLAEGAPATVESLP